MKETEVEAYLRDEVCKRSGIAYKFTSPRRRNVPDRICVLPLGEIIFVECKATGKEATAAQSREHERLRSRGHRVEVVDCTEQIDAILLLR